MTFAGLVRNFTLTMQNFQLTEQDQFTTACHCLIMA